MRPLLLLALAMVVSGCSSISTEADYNTEANFDSYQSWAWVAVDSDKSAPYQQDGLNDQRIRNAVASQLNAKGLQQTSADKADLLVNYFTSVETKVDVDTFYSSFGYHPYYYRYPHMHSGFATETRVREYKEGTLMVDLIDADSKALLWRGSGSGTVKKKQSPEQRTEAVNEAVTAILAQYPPQPEK